MTTEKEILDYLQLINTENIGSKTFSQLINKYGSAERVLAELPSRYNVLSRETAQQEINLAKHLGVQILIATDPRYPQSLLNIIDYPPVLYAKGNIELLNNNICLAIVGSRNASINGRKLASKIAYDLSEQGVIIVSGMARGIDTAAHKGAMHALNQQGPTIAVLGTGIDIPYPAENKDIYNQIAKQGCLVSELPLKTSPLASNFPRRNRIISGLSNGILVAEANLHSGSLITAYTAIEQGREIMSIPGSPIDGRSQGSNKLIKDGAYLVECADDIIPILQDTHIHKEIKYNKPIQNDLFIKPLDNEVKIDNIPQHTNKKSAIIDFLTVEGVYVDEIIQATGLDSATVTTELLELELDEKIYRLPGNKVALIK